MGSSAFFPYDTQASRDYSFLHSASNSTRSARITASFSSNSRTNQSILHIRSLHQHEQAAGAPGNSAFSLYDPHDSRMSIDDFHVPLPNDSTPDVRITPRPSMTMNSQGNRNILHIESPDYIAVRRSTWSHSETLEVIDLTESEDDAIDLSMKVTKCSKCHLAKCVCDVGLYKGHAISLERFDNAAFPIMALTCPVCLDTLADILQQKKCIKSTICGHVFCEKCINAAVVSAKSCPTCRRPLSVVNVFPLHLPISVVTSGK